MSDAVKGTNKIRKIDLQDFLTWTLRMKNSGRRLSQACAAWKDEKLELSYSFADDDHYTYETLRILVDIEDKVPSISDFYSYADFYENEMQELFGVNIRRMNRDYQNKFYRISKETPFLPEDAAKRVADFREAEKKAKEAGEVVSLLDTDPEEEVQ